MFHVKHLEIIYLLHSKSLKEAQSKQMFHVKHFKNIAFIL
jgi:hypothetical protein